MTPKPPYVKSYMQTNVNIIDQRATLSEAIALMVAKKTNGLVVINGDNKLHGILSSWDIIKYVVPDYLEHDRSLSNFASADIFVERVKKVANDPIKKFITSKVVTVFEDDTLIEAATRLTENQIRQLPVISKDKKVIGYINRTDIKYAIADILGVPREPK